MRYCRSQTAGAFRRTQQLYSIGITHLTHPMDVTEVHPLTIFTRQLEARCYLGFKAASEQKMDGIYCTVYMIMNLSFCGVIWLSFAVLMSSICPLFIQYHSVIIAAAGGSHSSPRKLPSDPFGSIHPHSHPRRQTHGESRNTADHV